MQRRGDAGIRRAGPAAWTVAHRPVAACSSASDAAGAPESGTGRVDRRGWPRASALRIAASKPSCQASASCSRSGTRGGHVAGCRIPGGQPLAQEEPARKTSHGHHDQDEPIHLGFPLSPTCSRHPPFGPLAEPSVSHSNHSLDINVHGQIAASSGHTKRPPPHCRNSAAGVSLRPLGQDQRSKIT